MGFDSSSSSGFWLVCTKWFISAFFHSLFSESGAMKLSDLLKNSGVQFGSTVLQAAIEEQRKSSAERLGKECVAILDQCQSAQDAQVSRLRQLRKAANEQKKAVVAIGRAIAYFKATGNPFPFFKAACVSPQSFCRNVGLESPTEDDYKIPDSFTANEVEDDDAKPAAE